ncbi:MAG: GNAT family N-acetyltransferase [Acidimicrobiia bacterium]|nr:GNAT family N-acetyltransferase [Acidimicrobiia bacterium]
MTPARPAGRRPRTSTRPPPTSWRPLRGPGTPSAVDAPRTLAVEIRAVAPDELEVLGRVTAMAFGQDPDPAAGESYRKLLELERSRGTFEQGRMVGGSFAYGLELTIPGGEAAAAGVASVGVLPSHRRRGIMRRMVTELLSDARDRGDILAVLWSTEVPLYGRFGFGVAGVTTKLVIDRFPLVPHRLAPRPAPVVLVEPDEAKELLPPVFDRKRREVPGMFARSEDWWELEILADAPRHRGDASSLRYALALDSDGHAIGYAQYRTSGAWEGIGLGITLKLEEMIALTPAAYAGLWNFLVNQDLLRQLRAWNVPAETALHQLFANFRESQTLNDGLWLRILDVEAALSARRYSADGSLVLGVFDPMSAEATRYRLEVSGGMGSCRRVSDAPDLSLDLEDLSAGFLGRARFRRLGSLGRLKGEPAARALADAMFDWDPQPWCQEVF